MPSAFGDVLRVVAKMKQRIQRLVSFEPDIAAAPAISTRRPAARHKLFTTKSRHAVAAVPAPNANFGTIYEQLRNVDFGLRILRNRLNKLFLFNPHSAIRNQKLKATPAL
jgi:hypothetical protein